MSYYQALGLTREPFSNSPDPDMLYRARPHLECLQHMEIAVRLRRGLNVVLGEVGTGKTTLSRELVRLLVQDGDIDAYLLDDPYCPSTTEFLLSLTRLFGLDVAAADRDAALLKDALKQWLLTRSQDGRRIVTLLIDEGQKITPECLELLRELLNFETNTHKLLQIVIFAQTEFEEILLERPNLDDRVNYRYRLMPLDRQQTRRMIETRLALCATDGKVPPVFTRLALRRVHKLTGGYPRKIVRLCHLSMLLAVGFGKRRIGWGLVGRASRESRGPGRVWLRRLVVAGAAGGLVALTLSFGPALPDARQAALDALGRLHTQLTALAFDPASKPAPQEPVATDAPAIAEAVAAPQVEKAKPASTLPGQSAFEEALGLEETAPATAAASPAKVQTAKAGEPAAAKVDVAAAAAAAPIPPKAGSAPAVAEPAVQTAKAPAAKPATAAPQAAPAEELASQAAPIVAAQTAPATAAPILPQTVQAPAGAPGAAAAARIAALDAPLVRAHGQPQTPSPAAAPAPALPPSVAATAQTGSGAAGQPAAIAAAPASAMPHAPASPQALGAALSLSAAALPPDSVEQVIVVDPEYVGEFHAAPVSAPVAPAPAAALPQTLGETTVRSGWAVTRQAARIYGNGGKAVMARIAKANPGIDFNRVRAGEPIAFPAIPADPLPEGACLIRVASADSLDKGFAVIGRQRESDPVLSLYCTQQPGLGLRFDVVLAHQFASREEAEAALVGMSRELAAKAVVLDHFPAGTVAFTDLGLWNGLRTLPKTAAPAVARQVAVREPATQQLP